MKKKRREHRLSISRAIQKFKVRDKVHICIDSSIQKGMPHRRFHGFTGEIKEKRGKVYIVKVVDGKKPKELFIRPCHLRLQE